MKYFLDIKEKERFEGKTVFDLNMFIFRYYVIFKKRSQVVVKFMELKFNISNLSYRCVFEGDRVLEFCCFEKI